ncbi:MAG: DUF1343 domain-containing protein [Bacteroidetes bacterium]|nr:DUF1343 domain-containing protein [Bacteroidota bacterium]
MSRKKLLFGIDSILHQKTENKNTRYGLVTNNAATTSDRTPTRIALLKAGFHIVKLFSPEHGLTAKGEDGVYQNNSVDPLTLLPVISLYGEKSGPDETDLADIDAILFDIPDSGCRFYTYLWTMTFVMEACAGCKKKFILLDRPNPISGNLDLAEGPMLDEKNCSSFIGRWSIPIRHCCTLGELAYYFSQTRINKLDLEIIRIQNWNRNEISKKTSTAFIPPSPAITDIETALLYPGMGLLEGINVNEGRGTDTPFKIVGAPWIKKSELQEEFLSLKIKGIRSQAHSYIPVSGQYVNENCNGIRFSITDASQFRPVHTGLQLIHLLISLYPDYCTNRFYKTNVNPSGENHLDKLSGVAQSLEKIKKGEIPQSYLNNPEWKALITPFLLY